MRLKIFLSLSLFSLVFILSFQNCSLVSRSNDSSTSGSVGLGSQLDEAGFTVSSDPVLLEISIQILTNKCSSCHGAGSAGGVKNITHVAHLIATGLVVAGQPLQGRLMGSIIEKTMPKSGAAVTADEVVILQDWIKSIQVTGTVLAENPFLRANQSVQVDEQLDQKAKQILNINCGGCHQSASLGGVSNILDRNHDVEVGLIKPGDPKSGRLIASIMDRTMPKGPVDVTSADLQVLNDWILSMKIVDQPRTQVSLIALGPTFTSLKFNVLERKCVGCHGPVMAKEEKNYDNYLSASRELRNEKIPRSMPPAPYPPLTAEERRAVTEWLALGAQNN